MTVIGFNFRKINAQQNVVATGKVNIANNVAIKKVEETTIPVGTAKQKTLRFSYEFVTSYEPNIGNITIEGDVIYLAPEAVVAEVLKGWKKDKTIKKEVLSPVLNSILSKCSIKGLLLSQDINLPSPVQMPRVNVK